MHFTDAQLKRMYNQGSSVPGFWEVDAILSKTTSDSPYRQRAIELLKLNSSSRVLDVACGVGHNFKILQSYLCGRGPLVAIDVSDKALELARRRVHKNGWTNVELIEGSILTYQPEVQFDGVLCTFAIEVIPDYLKALNVMLASVKPGGRIAMIGYKDSTRPVLRQLNTFFNWMSQYVGGVDTSREAAGYLRARTQEIAYEEGFGGFYYIQAVETPTSLSPVTPT